MFNPQDENRDFNMIEIIVIVSAYRKAFLKGMFRFIKGFHE